MVCDQQKPYAFHLAVLVISLLMPLAGEGQEQSMSFNNLTIEDGLSQGNINDITQDAEGFIWIATQAGLNRYDGYAVKTFQRSFEDTLSLPDNLVNTVYEDKSRRLWLGTAKAGLVRYDRSSGNFYKVSDQLTPDGHIPETVDVIQADQKGNLWLGGPYRKLVKYNPGDSTTSTYSLAPDRSSTADSLSNYQITTIEQTGNGDFWVGTEKRGLFRFDPADGKTKVHLPFKRADLAGFHIHAIATGQKGRLWIGGARGLVKVTHSGSVNGQSYKVSPARNSRMWINDIEADSTGHLWLATFQRGLVRYTPATRKNHFYQAHPDAESGLLQQGLNVLARDEAGSFWIGTNGRGVNWFSLNKKFDQYPGIPTLQDQRAKTSIRGIEEDHQGRIWIGSYAGIDCYDPATNTVRNFPYKAYNPETGGYLYNESVYSVFEDSDQRLWIGSEGSGLYHFDRQADTFINYSFGTNKLAIHDIAEGVDENLWLAADDRLLCFDPENETFQAYLKDQFETVELLHIEQDQRDRLWIASNKGYFIFDPRTRDYQHINKVTGDSTGLLTERIQSFTQTDSATMWMATNGGGIARIRLDAARNPGTYQHYTQKDGLSDNVAYGILADQQGDLWISTNDGLSHFRREQGTFTHYKEGDGLQSNEFNSGSFHKTRDGKLYFGGIDGLNSFRPEKISQNPYKPPVVLKQVTVMGSPLAAEKPLHELQAIELAHDEDIISLTFAALNYLNASQNKYAYKLEGFTDEWKHTGSQRAFTFTNLDPGTYTLKVKASNNDGVWNEQPATVELTVIPPFWQTYWFYGLVGILVIGGSSLAYYWRVRALHQYQRQLQHEVEERTRAIQRKNEELKKAKVEAEKADKAKSDFLASMSHEIRTPMNAVVGMADLLKDTPLNNHQHDYLQTIRHSSENLLNIINDILDLSKIEAEKLKLEQAPFSVRTAAEEATEVFAAKAYEKNLDLACWVDEQLPYQVTGDVTRLKQVIANLLSNALKFTDSGYVKLEVKALEPHNPLSSEEEGIDIQFSVTDTGIGIEQQDFDKLFEKFSQADASTTRKYGGTGLGLSICQKLVKLMGGQSWLQSQIGAGSAFSFRIPASVYRYSAPDATKPDQLPLAQTKALVAGKQGATATILQAYLRNLGCVVTSLSAQADARHMYPDTLKKADFIFLDVDQLETDAVSQLEAAASPEARIIHLSLKPAHTSRVTILRKPVKYHRLVEAIKPPHSDQQQPAAEPANAIDQALGQVSPLRILLVEDNTINQQVIVKQLARLGYSPETCNNGKEAVDQVARNAYDLVFMDVQMPEMDGVEATKAIREQVSEEQQPKIVALTANAIETDQAGYINQGMDDCLLKPIKAETLQNKIRTWFSYQKA